MMRFFQDELRGLDAVIMVLGRTREAILATLKVSHVQQMCVVWWVCNEHAVLTWRERPLISRTTHDDRESWKLKEKDGKRGVAARLLRMKM
jgi:hypothetical protein